MRLPAPERRQQLLETALEVFAVRGFHDTSMNDVAAAAGVTKPVLYQHFTSKRQLYLEMLGEIGGELRERITKATAEATSPREQLDNGFLAYFGFVHERGDAFRILFGAGTLRDPEFAAVVRDVQRSIADAIATLIVVDGLDEESRGLLAYGVVGIAEGTSRHWVVADSGTDPVTLARQVSELAWKGLRGIGRSA